jgi:F420-dependent oxidoreductase-like protein
MALALEAEALDYSVVWAAEAYGSDCPTVLAYLAAKTERIDLGAGVMQIPARTPAMTAMTAATLDTLSNGRFRLGLGVSGPQVSEGWHGVRFDKPLARTREYVNIVHMALARQKVRYDGDTYVLPLPDGPGKALTLTMHPVRERIPVYLAAVGPKNLELAGEIADGWLAIFFAPDDSADSLDHLDTGLRRSGRDRRDFDIVAGMPLVIDDDVSAAADVIRPYASLYVGGMGSREKNFYHALATRMGYGDAADNVQNLYLNRDYAGAAAAVPETFIDSTALIGPVPRIAEKLAALAESGVTAVSVSPQARSLPDRIAALRGAAEALAQSGVGG